MERPGREALHVVGPPSVIAPEAGKAPQGEMILPVDRLGAASLVRPAAADFQPGAGDAPDVLGLLKALRRRWCLALFGGLAVGSAAAAGVYLNTPPPKYTASALVHVSEKRPREIFETRESDVGFRTYQETQVILARSRRVITAALAAPGVADLSVVRARSAPIEWLSTQIKVDFPRGSEILSISMSANCPPAELATLVNAVTDAYLTQIVEQERLDRIARFDRLKSLFADYQSDLIEKRSKFKDMAGSIGASDKGASAVRQQMMVEHLGLARQELLRLQSDFRRSQARLNVLSSRAEPGPTPDRDAPRPEAPQVDQADPQLMLMLSRMDDLKAQVSRLKRNARKGSVDAAVQAAEREYRQVAKSAEDRRKELLAAPAKEEAEEAPAPVDERRREVEEYLDILREQEKVLKQEIASLESQMSTLNVKSMDFHWLEDEIDAASGTAKMVGAEVQSMTVEMQAPPRIRLIERAEIPTLGDPLRRHKFGAFAGAGAFLAFLGCVSFWEFRSRKVDMPAEVSDRIGLRIIGDLPRVTAARLEGPKGVDRERLVQSIDAVRTMLLNVDRHQSFQLVMITSALKGEGKSSLSCHLAASLARAGRNVLLLDCDLRKPSVHSIFQVPPTPGLCDVLRGEVDWEDVVRGLPIPGLSLIPAGRCDHEVIELLPRGRFPDLLTALRERFDFIIVDSAPVLQVTDTLIFSQHMDAVVFSVLRGVSQLPQIRSAFDRLASMNVRILGAVVAGVPARSSYYSYGSYPSNT